MSDKELLELAARAAGSGAVCWTESEYPRGSGKHGALWNYVGHMDTAELWNPLEDDGDALRLAVKLGLDVEMHGCLTNFPYAVACECSSGIAEEEQPDDGDPYAATRRAIVRAAAEIGKTLAPNAQD